MHAANPVRTETPTSRRAQRVIFHFLLPRSSKTHSWWPQDFELCEIFPCLPLCARSTLSSLLLSPRRYPFFLSLFLFRFPLIVRSRAEPQEFEFRLRYIRSYLSLVFFSSFSLPLSFSRASTRSLCHDRRLVSESTASIRSTIVNWNAIVQKPNVYIYVYIYRFRGNIFRQEYLVSWKTFVSVLLREERIGREGRKIVLRINQIEIIRANSANLPQLSLSKIKSKHTQRFEIFRGGRDGIPPGTLLFSREHDAGNFITTRYLSIKLEEGREEHGRGGRIVSFARTGVKKIIERERKKKEKKDRRNGHIIC